MIRTLACLVTPRQESIALVANEEGALRWRSESDELQEQANVFVPIDRITPGHGNPASYAIKRLATFIPGRHTVIAENQFYPWQYQAVQINESREATTLHDALPDLFERRDEYDGPSDLSDYIIQRLFDELARTPFEKRTRKRLADEILRRMTLKKIRLSQEQMQILNEALEPAQPGYTGELTDSLGRTYHFVNGHRVKGAGSEEHVGHARLDGQDVKVLSFDEENGLLAVESPETGEREVVPYDKVDYTTYGEEQQEREKRIAEQRKVVAAREDYEAHGTKAKAFKEWFGDWENEPGFASKVVDHEGKPQETHGVKRVYHGRPVHFDVFDKKKIGQHGTHAGRGFYFAEDVRIAETYADSQNGEVLEAYLAIKNPFDFDTQISREEVVKMGEAALKRFQIGYKRGELNNEIETMFRAYADDDMISKLHAWEIFAMQIGEVNINPLFQQFGYDGVTHQASDMYGSVWNEDGKADYGRVWVAFEPNQIKAVDNRGTFDPQSKNIMEADATGTGFTGEITDSLGRHRKYVNGKPVPLGHETSAPIVKVGGEEAHVIAKDSEHGLVRVKTASGEKVVKADELEYSESTHEDKAPKKHQPIPRKDLVEDYAGKSIEEIAKDIDAHGLHATDVAPNLNREWKELYRYANKVANDDDEINGEHWEYWVEKVFEQRHPTIELAKAIHHANSTTLHESASISAQPPQPGFTGEITDRLGRHRKFVNGKPVPMHPEEEAQGRQVTARVGNEEVHVIARDTQHGLVRVKGPSGDRIVKQEEIEVGGQEQAPEQNPEQAQEAAPEQSAEDKPQEGENNVSFGQRMMNKYKDLRGKISEMIDQIPGAKLVRKPMDKFTEGLKARYGETAAEKILASAVGLTWGAFLTTPLHGIPNYIPTPVAAIPGLLVAEAYYQLTKDKPETPETPATPEQPTAPEAAPETPAPFEFTRKKPRPSEAEVHVRINEDDVKAGLAEFYTGMDYEEGKKAVASTLGAPDDAEVFIFEASPTSLSVSIKHPDIKMATRTMQYDEDKQPYIYNEHLELRVTGKGLGSNLLKNEVDNAAQHGFAYIATTAGGKPGGKLNGYYTWPLLGYNGNIDDIVSEDVQKNVRAKFPEAKTVRDVMRSEGGQQWWKENGGEFNAKFDLGKGSESRKILDAYLAKKKAK